MTVIRGVDGLIGAKVTDDGQLVVRAIQEAEIEHASGEGQAYCWFAPDDNVGAGDTLLFIKNLGNIPLVLDRLNIKGGNIASDYQILLGKVTTVPDAINITGTNLNPRFGDEADVHAVADEDAIADGTLVETIHVITAITHHHDLTGIILEKGVYIQINQESESTAGACAIYGHFQVIA